MERIDTKKVYEGKFLSVFEDSFSNNDKTINWETVRRNGNDNGGVVIVPFHVKKNKYVLTKEFRIPIEDFEISFPAGLVEDNETIEETVKREILEETGLHVVNFIKISPMTYSTAGLTDEKSAIVFVNVDGEINDKFLQPSEEILPFFVSIDEMSKLLALPDLKWGSKAWLICENIVNVENIKRRFEMTIHNLENN